MKGRTRTKIRTSVMRKIKKVMRAMGMIVKSARQERRVVRGDRRRETAK